MLLIYLINTYLIFFLDQNIFKLCILTRKLIESLRFVSNQIFFSQNFNSLYGEDVKSYNNGSVTLFIAM
jgi:hypothetical protein